jgi:hypothetical protein
MVVPVPAQISKLRPRLRAAPLRPRSLPLLTTHCPLSFVAPARRGGRHPHHLASISLSLSLSFPFSVASAYFPSPLGCTTRSNIPNARAIQDLGSANSFACKQLPPLSPVFASFLALPSFVFNRLQPLLRKTPGVGGGYPFPARHSPLPNGNSVGLCDGLLAMASSSG